MLVFNFWYQSYLVLTRKIRVGRAGDGTTGVSPLRKSCYGFIEYSLPHRRQGCSLPHGTTRHTSHWRSAAIMSRTPLLHPPYMVLLYLIGKHHLQKKQWLESIALCFSCWSTRALPETPFQIASFTHAYFSAGCLIIWQLATQEPLPCTSLQLAVEQGRHLWNSC